METTTQITKEDVDIVLHFLRMELTDNEVNQVLTEFDAEAENDVTATWDLIVENIIYNIKNN